MPFHWCHHTSRSPLTSHLPKILISSPFSSLASIAQPNPNQLFAVIGLSRSLVASASLHILRRRSSPPLPCLRPCFGLLPLPPSSLGLGFAVGPLRPNVRLFLSATLGRSWRRSTQLKVISQSSRLSFYFYFYQ